MSKQTVGCLILILVGFCMVGLLVYQLPPVNERLGWRVSALRAQVLYALNPPEEEIFQPAGQPLPNLADKLPAATASPVPTLTPTIPGPTNTPAPSPTPTFTPTPLPPQASLTGITHMYQGWNNCGPANLAMALSYWDWEGDQNTAAAYLKPNKRDKNVMPYEMADFVNEQTGLRALVRAGGDLEMIKAFIAAGFPVIVEKGFEGPRFDGWMGHYEVVSGYDDTAQVVYVQDSYDGPDLKLPYADLLDRWRAFNYTYIVPYAPELEGKVLEILGEQADPKVNYQNALEKATVETIELSGRDQFFARFNQGTNLVYLHDYQNAATAFDAAFANYASIPKEIRPWRMMWYQTAPYFAYYYTGRYQDVIDLADQTFQTEYEKILEESFYWRGMAKLALGDTEGAIEDFQKSAQVHPDFTPAIEQLRNLGVEIE